MNPVTISSERRVFSFVLLDDEGQEHTFSMPCIESLPASYTPVLAKIGRIKDSDEQNNAYFDFGVEMFEKYAPGIFDIAVIGDMKEILLRWIAASGDVAGES